MPGKNLSEDTILAYLAYNEKRRKFQIYTLSEERIRECKDLRIINKSPYIIGYNRLGDMREIVYSHKGVESELVERIENIFNKKKGNQNP